MLKLKLKVKRRDRKIEKEVEAIANSGFTGAVPQLLIPQNLVSEFKFREILEPKISNKRTADGRIVSFITYEKAAYVRVITDDRKSPEVLVDVLVGSPISLMNDALISALKIVIIDAKEGLWCFLDELGKKVRRGVH